MLKVLIVDDEFWIRESLKTAFDWEGNDFCIVGEASDANSAYKLFLSMQPDIVISDIRLKTSNGLDLLERIHTDSPGTALIVISGYEQFDYAKRAISSGVLAYLVKPIDDEELKQAVMTAKKAILQESSSNRAEGDSMLLPPSASIRTDIKMAVEYIQVHYAEPLTVSQVANHIGITEAHFSRLFKQEMGVTFLEYLTRYRIYIAARLLRYGNYRVNEAAALVGYSKPEYFTEIFKKVMGSTPKSYILNRDGENL